MGDDFKFFPDAPARQASRSSPVAIDSPPSRVCASADGETPSQHLSRAPNFASLGVEGWLVRALNDLSVSRPSAVQTACIPPLLSGEHVIASAITGTGKTMAFALPILQKLACDPHGFYALVLTPTRELALQIAEQFQALGKEVKLTVSVAVGGLDMMEQSMSIAKKPHVVIATPGRLVDLIRSCQVSMPHLRYLIFDEADRLLHPKSSFMSQEIPFLIAHFSNPSTKWAFFSATMTEFVADFFSRHRPGNTIFRYDGNVRMETAEGLKHSYMLVPSSVRDAYLVSLLCGSLAGKPTIVFVGKCKTCELTAGLLRELKIKAVAIHGKMPQKNRISALQRFRSGKYSILITTDVASRGLDIPVVQFVVNFDLPMDYCDYVHRVGRASRAGRNGDAISFVHELDVELLDNIKSHTKSPIEPSPLLPKESEIVQILNSVSAAKRKVSMGLHDRRFDAKSQLYRRKHS